MAKPIRSNYDLLSASKVWQAFLAGDRVAFEYLFKKYYDDLYHYAVKFSGDREMAEDHIQKLFLKIWRRRHKLKKVKSVKTYLWTALRRSMIDTFRKRSTEQKYIDKLNYEQGQMQFTPEEFIIRDEIASIQSHALKEAIDQLTPKEREALYLKFYEGMSYEEIEQVMSVSYQTSRNYVYKSLKALKTILSPEIALGLLFIGLFMFSHI